MNGDVKHEQMVERLKLEVKEIRHGECAAVNQRVLNIEPRIGDIRNPRKYVTLPVYKVFPAR